MRVLAILLLLTACAPAGDFPSLLPRAAEAVGPDTPLPLPPPPRPADPAVAARVGELVRAGRAGNADFEAALPAARAAAAAAGPAESESWTRAQQALSRLDAAGGGTIAAVADLDALAVSIGADGERTLDLEVIRSATAELTPLIERQRETRATLAASLAPAPG